MLHTLLTKEQYVNIMLNLLSMGKFDKILAMDIIYIIANYGENTAEWRYNHNVETKLSANPNLLVEKKSVLTDDVFTHKCQEV